MRSQLYNEVVCIAKFVALGSFAMKLILYSVFVLRIHIGERFKSQFYHLTNKVTKIGSNVISIQLATQPANLFHFQTYAFNCKIDEVR